MLILENKCTYEYDAVWEPSDLMATAARHLLVLIMLRVPGVFHALPDARYPCL